MKNKKEKPSEKLMKSLELKLKSSVMESVAKQKQSATLD